MERIPLTVPQIVAGLPTMIGFEPHERVVAVGLDDDRLPVTALVIDRERLLDARLGARMAAEVAHGFAREGARSALLVTYTDHEVRDGCPALEALRWELEFAVEAIHLIAVKHGRWFWPGCYEECCPREGTALPSVPHALPRAIPQAGTESLAGRDELARAQARADSADRWAIALAEGTPGDARAARLLATDLDDVCVRDFVVLTILGANPDAAMDALHGIETGAVADALDEALGGTGVPDPLQVERFRAVAQRVARAARGRRRKAATLTVLAVLDWWEGELALAQQRCDAALESLAGYRLAELVRLAAARGIAPGWVAAKGKTAQTPESG